MSRAVARRQEERRPVTVVFVDVVGSTSVAEMLDPEDVLGTDVPPIENLPNRTGVDPHENPRRTPAEQQMVSDFLMPNAASKITDTCNGNPCFDYLFSGP